MRYLKPHFYDQFTCTAGDCPDTCCAGWQIVIDEDSLERYGKEQGEFGKRLRNSIDWEEECFYQKNRRCAFLNDENLCDLYKALGPDALCDTCRLYPRHTEEYEGLRELSLSLSCPEAARIILSCQEPVRFLAEETDEEDDFEEFDFMMFSQLEDTRDVLFKILQNRTMPLQERMRAAEQLAEQYQICMEEQREYDIDDLLRKYEKHLEEGTLSECAAESLAQKGVDAAGFHVWERQRKELAVLRSLERLRPEWDEVLDGTEKVLYQNGESAYQAICEEFHRTFGAKSSRRAEWENIGVALLDHLHIPYSRVEHEPAETMEACAAISDALGIRICKNLFLCNRQKTDFYLLTMPEDKPFHTKDLSAQIGSSRLSFAPPELMEELIRCTPGSASVLGLAYDTEHRVRLLMDRETYEAAQFGCHPCLNTGSLRMATADLLNVFLPHTGHTVTVVDLPNE